MLASFRVAGKMDTSPLLVPMCFVAHDGWDGWKCCLSCLYVHMRALQEEAMLESSAFFGMTNDLFRPPMFALARNEYHRHCFVQS